MYDKIRTFIIESVSKTLYHGDNKDISPKEFSPTRYGWYSSTFEESTKIKRHGIFFSDSKSEAQKYGNIVYKAKVIMKNLAILDDYSGNSVKYDFVDSFDPHDPNERPIWWAAKFTQNMWSYLDEELGDHFVKFLKENGYDSVSFDEDDGRTYVIFDPKQIISWEKISVQ